MLENDSIMKLDRYDKRILASVLILLEKKEQFVPSFFRLFE